VDVEDILLGRDVHEILKTETFTCRDETEMLASPAEMRPRRDVCRSQDVTETLK